MGCWSIARLPLTPPPKKKKKEERALNQASLTICWNPFILLGGERHCVSKVSCPSTQHIDPAGLKPGILYQESSALTIRVLRLPAIGRTNVGTPHQILTCQQSVNIKINCLSNTHSRSENSSIGNCQEGIAPLDISFATASTNPNSWAWMSESVSCSSMTGLHPSPPSSKKTKKRGFQIYLIIYLDLFKQILLRRERHSERKVS